MFFRLSVCQKALEMYYYLRFMYVLKLVFSLIKVRADFMFTLNADILGENTVCGEYQDGDAPLRHRILRAQYTWNKLGHVTYLIMSFSKSLYARFQRPDAEVGLKPLRSWLHHNTSLISEPCVFIGSVFWCCSRLYIKSYRSSCVNNSRTSFSRLFKIGTLVRLSISVTKIVRCSLPPIANLVMGVSDTVRQQRQQETTVIPRDLCRCTSF